MPRLILLLAIGAVIYILFLRVQAKSPQQRKAEYIKLGLGVAVIVVIGLTVTGRMHWLGAAITGLLVTLRQSLPALIRLFPMLASLRKQSTASASRTSTVETPILKMHLDHDDGSLQGEVLQGEFMGQSLADLDRDQLQALLQYCRTEDAESEQLLDSYLQRRFPGDSAFGQEQAVSFSSGNMERNEALAILGLEDSASDDDVVSAHRKLMQKLHPDRGGNNYLAAKLNQAKDYLLG